MRLNIEGDAAAARHMSVNIGTCACAEDRSVCVQTTDDNLSGT
jgi:hypothetical protein